MVVPLGSEARAYCSELKDGWFVRITPEKPIVKCRLTASTGPVLFTLRVRANAWPTLGVEGVVIQDALRTGES